MIIILSYTVHFRVNKLCFCPTLLKLVASSLKEKKLTSLSNVADTFRQSSVLIETPVSELYATLF